MGLWKGKKGSSVFYKIWNSNNKEKQGIREYQPEIRNPQSDGQADQRMRMLPAQLIKGALRDIVSRSFQGIAYGSKSRLEFLKYALRAETFPFLPKGYTEPVPGAYLISRGTLQQVACTPSDDDTEIWTTLKYNTTLDMATDTVGSSSTQLLAANANLQEGDQLTFVGCLIQDNGASGNFYNWFYWSMILDTSDTTVLQNIPGANRLQINAIADENIIAMVGEDSNLCAAGVIVSRQGSDGQYLRSNCTLCLVSSKLFPWFETSTRAGTRASYQTGQTRSYVDWPVEQDEESATTEDGEYTLSGLQGAIAPLNGQKVKVRINSESGLISACYISSDSTEVDKFLVNPNGNTLPYTLSSEVAYLKQSQVTALANLPTIVYTSNLGRAAMAAPMAEDEKPEAETKKTRSKK